MNAFILGALTLASALAGLFFLKFWRKSGDRFFLFFAFSFWMEGIGRAHDAIVQSPHEDVPSYYLLRLVAYVLIIAAIVTKNLPRRKQP